MKTDESVNYPWPKGAVPASELPEKEVAKVLKNLEKYPHADRDSLHFIPSKKRYAVRITCVDTEAYGRVVYTSDLWQTCRSEEAEKAHRATVRTSKKSEKTAATAE